MWRQLVMLVAWAGAAGATWAAPLTIPAIAYHDIVEQRDADAYAITRSELREQLRYLKSEGYTPVSLKQIDATRRGVDTLPARPVLLTFDDGLASFASDALPLLKEFGYPAVLAVVTAWIDGRSAPSDYNGKLLSWDALRAIRDAGNVEIISHSDNLHLGVRSNPQGNRAPAGSTRIYGERGGYETEAAFRARIRADLTRSVERLRAELQVAPMAIAWPYGKYDAVTVEEADRLGMTYHLTLDERPTHIEMLPRINRSTFVRYRRLADFDAMLTSRAYRSLQLRFIGIELDDLAGQSNAERDHWLSTLLARLELLRVNAVVVHPVSAGGTAFFPTTAMPVAADVLNRVLHQIVTRARVNHIYLRLPDGVPVEAYRDLARLNPFAGAVVGETDAQRFAEIAALLRYYNPAARVGAPTARTDADFQFIELDAESDEDDLAARARTALAGGSRAMFLLHRPATLSDARLARAMRVLRGIGVWHFGYDNDDAADNIPALRRVVPELRAHTIGAAP